MRKRPLCIVCLTFLIIRSIVLVLTSGQTLIEVPASSIFFGQTKETEVMVQGQVYKKTNTSKIQILYLKNNSIFQENNSFYESNILIYDDTFTQVPIGKTICVKGEPTQFERARNPGNFDQQLYYARQNLYGFVWSEKIMKISGEENWLLERLQQFRQSWKQILWENLSEQNAAVLSAMLLSEKSEMDADVKELYQKNGISHVLAISGLHISFIGLGIYKLFRKAGISYTSAGLISILILSAYVLMIGFSVSVIRAYVMLILRIGADITGRVYDMLTALMLAAAMLVAYQPLYLTDAAFYMSHGAVLGIVLVLPELKKLLPKRKWLEGCYASLAINVALFPVLLWFYFEIPTYSTGINMVIIPFMTWVLGLGMFGSVSYFIWKPAGRVLLKGCDLILSLFEWIGEIGCRLPFAQMTFGKPNWWEVLFYYILLITFMIVLRNLKDDKRIKKVRNARILLCVLTMVLFTPFPNGKVQITMLDVGQGDCIFMKGPQGKTYLIDGGSSDIEQLGKYRIEPFLKSQGVGSLDYVFVSHGDSDHYIGIEEMLNRQLTGVKMKMLVLPTNYKQDEKLVDLAKLAMEQEVDVAVIKAGQNIVEGDLLIQCLQPRGGSKSFTGNAGSMVLDVSFQKFDMLFTGDVEEEGEEQLLRNLSGKTYDVLKVAHHGSKNSTKEAFLKIVKPKIGLISCGADNSYGHPHEELLERLRVAGVKILMTKENGAITVKAGKKIQVYGFH